MYFFSLIFLFLFSFSLNAALDTGDGSDGACTEGTFAASGTYNCTTLTIGVAGFTIAPSTGDVPLIIKVQGDVNINGNITIDGGAGANTEQDDFGDNLAEGIGCAGGTDGGDYQNSGASTATPGGDEITGSGGDEGGFASGALSDAGGAGGSGGGNGAVGTNGVNGTNGTGTGGIAGTGGVATASVDLSSNLVAGSGGGAGGQGINGVTFSTGATGGGGGGALKIISGGVVTIAATIFARGGGGGSDTALGANGGAGGGGSGGTIFIQTNSTVDISAGALNVSGGVGGAIANGNGGAGGAGAPGRVRIDALGGEGGVTGTANIAPAGAYIQYVDLDESSSSNELDRFESEISTACGSLDFPNDKGPGSFLFMLIFFLAVTFFFARQRFYKHF